MDGAKILIVDDEPDILKILSHRLCKEGYKIVTATDGEEALLKFDEEAPDLIVLDLMLPKLDGFEVCRIIRQRSNVPIIILSARGDELDKLIGFRMGVDDYQTKPFSPAELALRIQAVLRRLNEHKQLQRPGTREELVAGNLYIDRGRRIVKIGDRPINLTAKEFECLWVMASHPNHVFSREQLVEQVWESDYPGDANNVTSLISRLREKIESDPNNPEYIKTVWGVGYKFGKEA
ncbi:response regulator transcription factor [Zhaonella formicivorans]|uniref:response regulator transcription factor n=1 Tax=Zhaonella formicivorans TaxID=2528593 RepID=UPI0010EC4301|nr:response regulator transcription factor [Zhaonella formicivorans]